MICMTAMKTYTIGLLLGAAMSFAPVGAVAGEWVDLTHSLSSESVFWPTAAPFQLTTDAEGFTEAGYYYSAYSFSAAEHGGTHIDAPIHFAEAQMTVDEIPLERLIGEAVVVDVTAEALADRDYLVRVTDFTAWEQTHGRIPAGSIVLIRTGYSGFWPDAARYLGTAERGQAGVDALHFPGLDPAAARWLLAERSIKSIGIDTASIDYGQSKTFDVHVALMTANVPAFENVTNLDRLPATGAFVVALPVKIEGGSGGPLRIVARLP
jgi:kynurenine formamidase